MIQSFEDLDLHADLKSSLESMNFSKPTPIQSEAIPHILAGKDILACAQTGTGKTAAYLLPVIDKLCKQPVKQGTVNTLVLVPTRELALQIDQNLQGFSYFCPISSMAIYGGGDAAGFDREKNALKDGADIVIATPGKIIMHLNLGYVKVEQLQHLILDEADRMLDMGFVDDIMKIVSFLPKERQNLMFSATMPTKIRELAKNMLKDPAEVNLAISKPAAGVTQAIIPVYEPQKPKLIVHLLKSNPLPSVIVFTSTKKNVGIIEKMLTEAGLNAKSISSDLDQSEREEALRLFRSRQIQILVATDIMARGIDIEKISLVINYDAPMDAEDYVHRVGRTARAENKGIAFTFVTPEDQHRLFKIEELIGTEIRRAKIPAGLGDQPTLSKENARRHKPRNGFKGKKQFRKKSA